MRLNVAIVSTPAFVKLMILKAQAIAASFGATAASIGISENKTMTDTNELENQIKWFEDLLDVLEAGDLVSGIEAVKAAIKLLERNRTENYFAQSENNT